MKYSMLAYDSISHIVMPMWSIPVSSVHRNRVKVQHHLVVRGVYEKEIKRGNEIFGKLRTFIPHNGNVAL